MSQVPYFGITNQDGLARTGDLRLPSGVVQTPLFMPVGTQATVKSLDPADLLNVGTELVLSNTYHLMLRPGADLIEQFGGVAKFMQWNRPILTDSGGFQVFSLAKHRKITPAGVQFRSHIDGTEFELTPEKAISIQQQLGADVSMVLDVCTGYDASVEEQVEAADLTHQWLPRNIAAFESQVDSSGEIRPLLFGIAQGGFDADRRKSSSEFVSNSSVDGCAIGGLSVGEPKDVLAKMLAASLSGLDWYRPRYLMGVGSPEDLWLAVGGGVDMFDCVLPTRVARHGGLFTPQGRVNIRASRYRADDRPVDVECDCYTCRTFSSAYIHHLFRAGELLAYRLATIHNLRFIMRQMSQMREAIQKGEFDRRQSEFLSRYLPADDSVRQDQRLRYRTRSGNR